MEYLIPAALVVLLVGAFVTFVALYSTRKGGPGAEDQSAADSRDASPGMGADDATPLGDTDQLSDVPSASRRFNRDEAEEPQETEVAPPESERLANRSF